jgi:hypothetical protein
LLVTKAAIVSSKTFFKNYFKAVKKLFNYI